MASRNNSTTSQGPARSLQASAPTRVARLTPPATRPVRSAPTPLVVPPGAALPGRASSFPIRRDGPDKVEGLARYVDDLVFPGAWYGATIRSTDARARLLAIEPDPAVDWSAAVLVTAADIPGQNVASRIEAELIPSFAEGDQPFLVPVGGEIRHHAEPVALIAAPDRETVRRLRDRVRLVTEPLPPVLDPEASEERFAWFDLLDGDPEAGFADADLVVEGTYRTGHQEQLYIESQGMIAVPGDGGRMTIHGSMQCPYYVHRAVQDALGLADDGVRIVQTETGGGFGGKEDYPSIIAVHAALLARRCGRPVRMVYDRHEDLVATTKRHPSVVRHRTGVTLDGRLLAMDIEVILDGGAYATLSPFVLSRATIHAAGPYRCPNVRVRARAVRTNTPPNGAFRGFGGPQVGFAAETQLSRIAEALGISPAGIRSRNVLRPGDRTATGQTLMRSVAAEEVLRTAVEATAFDVARARTERARAERLGASDASDGPLRSGRDRVASGIGLALGWHGAGFTGSTEVALGSVASLELGTDGRIRILVATTEMGQGTRTILPMLVADELGIPATLVEVAPQDTANVPDTGPTVASRTAMVVGAMCVSAARRLRAQVEQRHDGRPFRDVFSADAATHGATRVDQPFEPFADMTFDEAALRGEAHAAFGWAACVVRVDVDLDTGEVAVRDAVAVDDVGRVIHPVLCEGQVEGGTLQAIGYATIEEIKLQDGRYLNDRLATYLVPTALDAPTIRAILVEAPYDGLPHGAKGVGELPMNVGAPAVVAAIHDATGAWITELPASAERVLAAITDAALAGSRGTQ
jgi:CO/xanthine dehydrogenase Mo-binding subunit